VFIGFPNQKGMPSQMSAEGRILDTRFLRTLDAEPPPNRNVQFGRRGDADASKSAATAQESGQTDSGTLDFGLSPEFLRNDTGDASRGDGGGDDLLDIAIESRRSELESLENQITSLNSTLEIEQNRLEELSKAIDRAIHRRHRLERLRGALTRFLADVEAP
jgi:hypothetical protein